MVYKMLWAKPLLALSKAFANYQLWGSSAELQIEWLGYVVQVLYYFNKARQSKDNVHSDDQLGMSTSCWLGLSSCPGLAQQQEGVKGRFGMLSLGYLQAGVVTMVPTAIDTMSK